MEVKRRYLFHANALGFAGGVSRPYLDVVSPQAAAILPIMGGHSTVRVDNFRFGSIFSVDSAVSIVSGSESKDEDGNTVYSTFAQTTIEGLNVLNVITADRIVAQVQSDHTSGTEVPIQLIGSRIENLHINGALFEPPEFDELLTSKTQDTLRSACAARTAARKAAGVKALSPIDMSGNTLQFQPAPKSTVTSLYHRPDTLPSGCTGVEAWGITVPGLGDVYLGELVLSHGARRLTMLRVEMGSAIGGRAEFATVGGNGTLHP